MNWQDEEAPAPRPSKLPWLLGILVVGAGALLFFTLWQPPEPPDTAPVGPRHPAVIAKSKITGLELQPLIDVDETLTSESLRGKVAFVNFWGPWCAPCASEFPHLMQLRNDFAKDKDFVFVSVSCLPRPGNESTIEESTRLFLKSQGAALPVYIDENFRSRKTMLGEMNVPVDGFGYPTSIVIDREGNLRGCWIGYAPGWEVEMGRVVKQALTP